MTSQEYWSKRETEQLKRNIRDEALYIQEINKIYDYMLDSIQKEINGFYAKYATAEGISLADAKKRVSRLDIDAYNRKAERYVRNHTFSKEANEEMRLYNATMKINRLEMLKSNIGLELIEGFDELQKYYNTVLTDRTLAEFERQAGILGKSVLNNQVLAHSIVNASFHNARFSDRIWMHQDMLKNELAGLLKTGLIQGRHPRVLATHLRKLFGVSKANSERLMRTELARVQTEAQRRSFIENGYDKYEWISTEDSKVCDACARLDGQIFDVKDMQVGVNAPPIHPQDRCSTAAYMDREDFEKWLNEQGQYAASSREGNGLLKFNSDADYSISLPGYNREVQEGLSKASREVARLGGKDGLEHLILVDLRNGGHAYQEIGETGEVGGKAFWDYINLHKNDNYAFVHNHGIASSLSETDVGTLVTTQSIKVMVATQNDGLKYLAESNNRTLKTGILDELYEKDLKELNNKSQNGMISAIERLAKREEILVNKLLEDYTKGLVIQDGRN